jgi:hypothetical protein
MPFLTRADFIDRRLIYAVEVDASGAEFSSRRISAARRLLQLAGDLVERGLGSGFVLDAASKPIG